MKKLNDILCPVCDEPISEASLENSLICPHCKVNLKQAKFIDFLEYLVAQGIVDNVDFFDVDLYGGDFRSYETSELDEQDITETENPKDPTGMRGGNIMSIEEEYIKDLHIEDSQDDLTVFDPSEMDRLDDEENDVVDDFDD